MHSFSLNAPLPDPYGNDKQVRVSTQLQSHHFGSQSAGAAAGGRMRFAYSQCSGPHGCIGTIRCLTGGRRPLTGPPMLWRVLWQPGPLDRGLGGLMY